MARHSLSPPTFCASSWELRSACECHSVTARATSMASLRNYGVCTTLEPSISCRSLVMPFCSKGLHTPLITIVLMATPVCPFHYFSATKDPSRYRTTPPLVLRIANHAYLLAHRIHLLGCNRTTSIGCRFAPSVRDC